MSQVIIKDLLKKIKSLKILLIIACLYAIFFVIAITYGNLHILPTEPPYYLSNGNPDIDSSCLNNVYDQIFVISIPSRVATLALTLFQLDNEKIQYTVWEGHSEHNPFSTHLWNVLRDKFEAYLSQEGNVSSDIVEQGNMTQFAYKNKKIFFLRQTQIDILKFSKKHNFSKVLLLEDDIIIANPKHINMFCSAEPSIEHWYALNIGVNQMQPNDSKLKLMDAKGEMKYFTKNVRSYGTFGISFSYPMFDVLISLFDVEEGIGFKNLKPLDNLNRVKVLPDRSILQKCFNIDPNLILPDVTDSLLRRTRDELSYIQNQTRDKNASHFSKYWNLRFATVLNISQIYYNRSEIEKTYADFGALVRTAPSNEYLNKSNKPLLLFMHVPKTGGTSIERGAAKHGILWGWTLFRHLLTQSTSFRTVLSDLCKNYNVCNRNSPWHIPLPWFIKYYSDNSNSDSGDIIQTLYYDLSSVDYFCVVRNPYTKMISEYKYLISYGSATFNTFGSVLLKDENVTINNKTDYCDETVLNLWIVKALKQYKYSQSTNNNNVCVRGCHFVKQYDFVYDSVGKQVCKNVIYFEEYDEGITQLMAEYDLENVTESILGVHETVEAYCHGWNLSISNLTNETKSIIYDTYTQDFISFGYQF